MLDPDDRDGVRELLASEVEDEYAQTELQWLQDMRADRGGRHDQRIEVTGPRNRIAKLVRAPAIRTMVGQTETVVDLREAMDDGHIILANLSGGAQVYEKGADLLGRLLVRFLLFHAKRRQRPDRLFSVYLDECQRYLSGDVPVALAELRKQGCAMVLGHQWQSQLQRVDEEILSAVRNATNIKVAFRIKDHKEATDLAEMLLPLDLEKPVDVLNKETLVGYERGKLHNESATTSIGTNTASAHSVTDNVSETRSTGTTKGAADTITQGTSKSRATTVGESRRKPSRCACQQIALKDEFLSHVSHELRSPLNAIYQFVSILADGLAGECNPLQREYLQIITRNLTQLQSMIGELLDVTRAGTGKLSVDLQVASVSQGVEDAMNTVKGGG